MSAFSASEDCPFPADIHICTPPPSEAVLAQIERLRTRLKAESEYFADSAEWLTDSMLHRFLIARGMDEGRAFDMVQVALAWRAKRQPHRFEQTEGWAERISKEGETGKSFLCLICILIKKIVFMPILC